MKIMFNGCSHTEHSGFIKTNLDKLWVNLIKEELDIEVDNIGVGGSSNDEIFKRTVEYISLNEKPDYVVIQWSDISRVRLCSVDNDDHLISLYPWFDTWANTSTGKEIETVNTILHKHFDNTYIGIKHLIIYMIALQDIFKANDIKYVFVLGFHNFIRFIHNYKDFEMSKKIKQIFNIDLMSDEVIKEKMVKLKQLYNVIDQDKCLDFENFWFLNPTIDIDRSDDNLHSGVKTNRVWADRVKERIINDSK